MASAVSGTMTGTKPRTTRGTGNARQSIPHGRHAAAPRHPAAKHDGLFTGSGVLSFLEQNRRHAVQGSDAMAVAAEVLKRSILKSSRLPFSIDKRWFARRESRILHHASALMLEQARAMSLAAAIYRGQAGDPGTVKAQRNRGLDPTK
jgi:hypothetical protein